jgi:hypothetical protein
MTTHDPHLQARGRIAPLPGWVPPSARAYCSHVSRGDSLRALARSDGVSPSTVLRRVRALESRRDDPLFDEALDRLAARPGAATGACARARRPRASHPHHRPAAAGDQLSTPEDTSMTAMPDPGALIDDATLDREGKRVLRRLCEGDAFLAVGKGLDQAVVLREGEDGGPTRTATLPRAVAQAFVLKDWVSCTHAGRVSRYRITEAGRAALRRMLGDTLRHRRDLRGMEEAPSPFLTQHVEWGERSVEEAGGPRRLRVNLAESPLGGLARKKDKDGKPFLPMELVLAGERLRDDFERAQMGPRVGQNWERFLTAGDRGAAGGIGARGPAEGPVDARARVSEALRALGPGLGDVVLRVCCFLEGMEATEKRMGWSARSGKIVLRIALQRLAAHYDGATVRG